MMLAVLKSGLGVLAMLPVAFATGDDACRNASRRYDEAAAATEALRIYERCVANSLGRNDCSGEFGELELEQDRFEIAVAGYRACQGR